ncbi:MULTISPECIES: hypothetical protein [Reichenbachiella]|uniref:Uncharacterized protein n=1 Tax=Reichenbachiella agariperforans TaxID=156994 RepID=A0A1M6Q6R9_REIAG|nr:MULTISPECIES: hypothetical protein [Reichenbachiella]MBU2914242.1 hypothetical protein [Reichenbachiella agariperforans]RJE72973.1 hypothetical protein BGP76_03235 [Reichenbachiella sp. MSK19-1]SHK15845.1 hypothetical protein SAMN04488028_103191 [Reichenbachiella agariperforans]
MTVHQISIKIKSGYDLISVEKYREIRPIERVQLVSQKKIKFLDVEGNMIPTLAAIKDINKNLHR